MSQHATKTTSLWIVRQCFSMRQILSMRKKIFPKSVNLTLIIDICFEIVYFINKQMFLLIQCFGQYFSHHWALSSQKNISIVCQIELYNLKNIFFSILFCLEGDRTILFLKINDFYSVRASRMSRLLTNSRLAYTNIRLTS